MKKDEVRMKKDEVRMKKIMFEADSTILSVPVADSRKTENPG